MVHRTCLRERFNPRSARALRHEREEKGDDNRCGRAECLDRRNCVLVPLEERFARGVWLRRVRLMVRRSTPHDAQEIAGARAPSTGGRLCNLIEVRFRFAGLNLKPFLSILELRFVGIFQVHCSNKYRLKICDDERRVAQHDPRHLSELVQPIFVCRFLYRAKAKPREAIPFTCVLVCAVISKAFSQPQLFCETHIVRAMITVQNVDALLGPEVR
jgi:hypothetical protein